MARVWTLARGERVLRDERAIIMPPFREADPVAIFAGLIFNGPAAWRKALSMMADRWGPVDLLSAEMPFDLTDYYTNEMGPALRRRLVSFAALRSPAALPGLKHEAIDLERGLAAPSGARTVNIDVGYLDLHRVVLASTKERPQKLYLEKGIWADLTLRFSQGRFQTFPWTFPDFADGRYDSFLSRLRERYKQTRKTWLHADGS